MTMEQVLEALNRVKDHKLYASLAWTPKVGKANSPNPTEIVKQKQLLSMVLGSRETTVILLRRVGDYKANTACLVKKT